MTALATSLLLSVDVDANRFRFFAVELHPRDCGGAEIRRRWGRVGTEGRVGVEVFTDVDAARAAWEALLRRREKRGYTVATEAELRSARRLLAWRRSFRREPWQLTFPAAVGF